MTGPKRTTRTPPDPELLKLADYLLANYRKSEDLIGCHVRAISQMPVSLPNGPFQAWVETLLSSGPMTKRLCRWCATPWWA